MNNEKIGRKMSTILTHKNIDYLTTKYLSYKLQANSNEKKTKQYFRIFFYYFEDQKLEIFEYE